MSKIDLTDRQLATLRITLEEALDCLEDRKMKADYRAIIKKLKAAQEKPETKTPAKGKPKGKFTFDKRWTL